MPNDIWTTRKASKKQHSPYLERIVNCNLQQSKVCLTTQIPSLSEIRSSQCQSGTWEWQSHLKFLMKSLKWKASHDVINKNSQLYTHVSKSSISAYITALSGGAARSRSIFFASNAKIHGSKCCSSLEIPLHVQHRAASATMDAAAIPISPVKGWQPHARIQEPIATSHEQRHCANNESGLCSFANLEKPWDQAKLTR